MMWRVLFFSSSFICICPKHLFVIINNDIPWYHDDKLEKKKKKCFEAATEGKLRLIIIMRFPHTGVA